MDSEFLLAIGLAIFLLILSLIFNISKPKSSRVSSNLPPGKTGWPLIGETLDHMSCPEKFITDRMREHSPDVFQTSIVGERMAILCGPSGHKFICSNEKKLFAFWLPRSILNALSLKLDDPSPLGKLVSEVTYKFLKIDSISRYVGVMDSKAKEHLETHWVPYNEVKADPLAKEFTFSVSCRLFINHDKSEQVRHLAEPFFVLAERIMSIPVNLPGTQFNRAVKAARLVQERLASVVRERKRAIMLEERDQSLEGEEDLLTKLLWISKEKGVFVDEKEIAPMIVAPIFSGFSTTSSAITFALGHLAEHPHVYDQVLQEQLEIARSKQPGELLNWKDIQKMKYTWNVVCESMRLKPPAFGSFREAITDIIYEGFKIPKGWKVHWTVHSTNKDPKYFPDPEKFDPSRFEGNKIPPFAFVPFGAGPRTCAGKEYARIEVLVLIHNVVTRFKLRKSNPDEKTIYNPIPSPAEGLGLCLVPHKA